MFIQHFKTPYLQSTDGFYKVCKVLERVHAFAETEVKKHKGCGENDHRYENDSRIFNELLLCGPYEFFELCVVILPEFRGFLSEGRNEKTKGKINDDEENDYADCDEKAEMLCSL